MKMKKKKKRYKIPSIHITITTQIYKTNKKRRGKCFDNFTCPNMKREAQSERTGC